MYDIADFAPVRPAGLLRSIAPTITSTHEGCRVESVRWRNLSTGFEAEEITLSHPAALADVAWSRATDRDFCRLFEAVGA
jgi:hypothetical protein